MLRGVMSATSRCLNSLALITVLLLVAVAPVPVPVRKAEATPPASDRLFLWKVTPKAGKNFVYLLGSIHARSKDFYPLPDEIEDAYTACQVLAVEVDLAAQDQDALQELLTE